jgi:hypothetical protein
MKSGDVVPLENNELADEMVLPKNILKIAKGYFPNQHLLILTFNGDLYYFDLGKAELKLIDYNVKDIAGYSYIKEFEFYIIEDDLNTILVKTSKIPFLTISNTGLGVATITESDFYLYYLINKEMQRIKCENNINLISIKNKNLNDTFLIQKSDDNVFYYYRNRLHKSDISLVKEIYPNVIKLLNNTLNICYVHPGTDNKVSMKPIPTMDGKLTNSAIIRSGIYLVIDDKLYRHNEYDNQELKLIRENVKNIYDDYLII